MEKGRSMLGGGILLAAAKKRSCRKRTAPECPRNRETGSALYTLEKEKPILLGEKKGNNPKKGASVDDMTPSPGYKGGGIVTPGEGVLPESKKERRVFGQVVLLKLASFRGGAEFFQKEARILQGGCVTCGF